MKKFLAIFFLSLTVSFQAVADEFSLIRDTEIEGVLETYIRKIFAQVGLPPKNAKVVLVNDETINAFVAGGQTIFVHTGLITNAKTVDDLMFVLSHETGHIVGGHITRGIDAYQKSQTTALISTILGGLVAVAGRPDAGIAVMMGGSTSAMGMFTSYRQTEESAADRIAVDIMQKTGYSMQGFSNTMKLIKMQDRLNSSSEFTYLRTHPMTVDRENAISRFLVNPLPVHHDMRFELIKAKLIGFLYPPKRVFDIYRNDSSLPSIYAQSIAAYRDRRFNESLQLIDQLIKTKPNYPYFYELKAQFLLETGQIEPSITYYKKAISLMPSAYLMRLSLAQAYLQTPSKEYAKNAIQELQHVLAYDTDIPFAWQLLATCYDRLGQRDEIPYIMAEFHRTKGDLKLSKKQAKKALSTLKKGTPKYQRAEDILALPDSKN